jgi:triosephosphate isomerase
MIINNLKVKIWQLMVMDKDLKYKLIINFKAYKEATGKKAFKIAEICKKLKPYAKKKSVEIIVCPQSVDLREIAKINVTTFAQHIDSFDPGAHTGEDLAYAIKDSKADGTLISHSEHQLAVSMIQDTIINAKKYGLITCVCARDTKRAEEIASLKPKPDFVAVEPKELIGGDISISTAKPDLIKNSKKVVGRIPLLVGAGVKTQEDVKKSVELGARGILLASGVVKAKNVEKVLKDLIDGF